MDRAFSSGASGSPPAVPGSPSVGYATPGNAGTATPATKPGAYWYHMVTEELRKVITDAGLTPDISNLSQLSLAIQAIQKTGEVCFFARNTAPAGFIKANGAAISRATYAALFTAIGTTFGVGDGSTTFNVPDLRGEFLRGWDDSRGVDTGRAFGSGQASDIAPHAHLYQVTSAAGASTTAVSRGNVENPGTTMQSTNYGTSETRPRNFALLACIKY